MAAQADTWGRRRFRAASSVLDAHIRWVLVAPAVLVILFLTIYPLGYSMWVNFVNYDFAIPGHRWVGVDNFKLVWDDPVARNALWVTLGLSAAMVAVELVLGFALALAMMRPFPGRRWLFYAVLLRNMFPAVVFLIPLFIMMRWLHLVNTQWSLVLTYLTFGLPLSIWLLKGFYDNIPVQLEQAARIDGATRFKAFILVVMPLSSPGIIATAIYSFIVSWNEYVYALTFLNDQSKLTLPVGLQRFFTEYTTNWPGLMAASFIMSVPVVVMFLVLQKYFVKALTEGAVKS